MKYLVIFVFFNSLIVSCDSSYNAISCDLIVSNDKGVIVVELTNKTSESVFLTNGFNLEIHRQDSYGRFTDWTDIYLSNMAALQSYESNQFNDNSTIQISSESRARLTEEYLQKYDVLDSLGELSLRDFIDWNLESLLFLNKDIIIKQEVDLEPLRYAGGIYKIFYSYRSTKSFSYDTSEFFLPKSIDEFIRSDDEIKSDTLLLSF